MIVLLAEPVTVHVTSSVPWWQSVFIAIGAVGSAFGAIAAGVQRERAATLRGAQETRSR
jgi:hypothetical protein